MIVHFMTYFKKSSDGIIRIPPINWKVLGTNLITTMIYKTGDIIFSPGTNAASRDLDCSKNK